MNLVGNLLIAPPTVKGNFWHKTVILVTEHSHQSSVGLVLNKPSELSLFQFGDQLGVSLDIPGYVYVGGPVNPQSLTLLHSNEWSCNNTMKLNNILSISSSGDILTRLSLGDCPIYWRLFLGLCGWAPNQLLSEIKGIAPWKHENSWCITNSNFDLVFDTDGNEQWCKALDNSASEFAKNILT